MDGGGRYCLPGLVDVHSDGLERERMPRPGAEVPWQFAIRSFEGKLRAAGVTTVFHGASFEEGTSPVTARTVAAAQALCAEVAARGDGPVDHRILHRLDVRSAEGLAALRARLAGLPGRAVVSHEDHTPGQGQYADRTYYERFLSGTKGLTDDEARAHVDAMIASRDGLLDVRAEAFEFLGGLARAGAVQLFGHDPASAAEIEALVARGGAVAEFPTTVEAAEAARERGMPVVMGAPNALRGTSHAGNTSARELVGRGLVTALASDYLPSGLLAAAFLLAAEGLADLPDDSAAGDGGRGRGRRARRPRRARRGHARRPRARRSRATLAARAGRAPGGGPVNGPVSVNWPVPEPVLPAGVDPVLADTVRAAAAAFAAARRAHNRGALAETVATGADGTPTMRIDVLVEDAITAVAERHKVNMLSEEVGSIDVGSAVTLVVDPLDGSANAAAGVPLSCVAAVLAVDGVRGRGRDVLAGGRAVLARPRGRAGAVPHQRSRRPRRRCGEPAAPSRTQRRRVVAGHAPGEPRADPVEQLPGGRARRRGRHGRVRGRGLGHPPDRRPGRRDADGPGGGRRRRRRRRAGRWSWTRI